MSFSVVENNVDLNKKIYFFFIIKYVVLCCITQRIYEQKI